MRHAFLRYAYLRDAFLRYPYLRYAFTRYTYLRYAFLRYVFFALSLFALCFLHLSMPFFILTSCMIPETGLCPLALVGCIPDLEHRIRLLLFKFGFACTIWVI